jgi:anti-sigma B factor antagonist
LNTDDLQVDAVRRNGACVLRISGELDSMTAEVLADRVDAAVQVLPGPVVVDLSGLTFIDARGARSLNAVLQTLPGGRSATVRSCSRRVRRILDLLRLPLDGPAADGSAGPGYGAPVLLTELHRARLHAAQARLNASRAIADLTDTCIRVASTIERAGLVREQGREALARSRASRDQVTRSRLVPAAPRPPE